NLVADIHFRETVLLVEELEKESGVVCPRSREAELFDRGQLFLELRTQLFFRESDVPVNLEVRLLRDFFLRFCDRRLLFPFLFLFRKLDRALAKKRTRETEKRADESEGSHPNENGSGI